MKTNLIILILFFLVLGCSREQLDIDHNNNHNEDQIITLPVILELFEQHEITLNLPNDLHPDNIFTRELNHVLPAVFETDINQLISIYVYTSSIDVEKGIEDFKEKTAAADLVSHDVYEIGNILMFYVSDQKEIDPQILSVITEMTNTIKK